MFIGYFELDKQKYTVTITSSYAFNELGMFVIKVREGFSPFLSSYEQTLK